MSIPGTFEVSDTGAAVYTIPIEVPPGTAGMQPSLSLQYNSSRGNGLLGMGWSLAGLPAVTRCSESMEQDGAYGGVNNNGNDRFCLAGQRLVVIGGVYGADGSQYYTEIQGFSWIIAHGTASGGNYWDQGPAWFEAWTKAGQHMEFGNTTDSRVYAQGKGVGAVWALNKVSDTKGNTVTVSYTQDTVNGQYRPSRIDYTGNVTTGTPPSASVQFIYASSPTQYRSIRAALWSRPPSGSPISRLTSARASSPIIGLPTSRVR